MKCPRDNTALRIEPNIILETNKCFTCSGILIDINKIPIIEKLKHNKLLSLKLSKLHCPTCSNKMREFTYKNIVVDICPNCKCEWLDPGEEVIINDEVKWYDYIDGFTVFDMTSSKSSCSNNDNDILEFLAEAVGSIFDGL